MKLILANPRGFCAGVNMAIETLEKTLQLFGPPIYVYHEIVHNLHVVNRFQNQGVQFVDSPEGVPAGATLLFSAHGVSPLIRQLAQERQLRTIDATCPLVTKVHLEAVKFAKMGYTIILIGHEGHDEVLGTMGEAPSHIVLVESVADVAQLQVPDESKLAYLTQTTLSVDDTQAIIQALQTRFPAIQGPHKSDICYATQNRQEAVKLLSQAADVVLVLGSQNSSNSQRLKELAFTQGKRAYLIDGPEEIQPEWLNPDDTVLITAGASAPENVVQQTVQHLIETFQAELREETVRDEDVHFPLPRELRQLLQVSGPVSQV